MQKRKGFTLIELLIVVAILGLLAAIAIPQYSFYRIRSYNTTALTDLGNFKTVMESSSTDLRGYPIGTFWINTTTSIGTSSFSPSSKVAICATSISTSYCAAAAHVYSDTEYGICAGTGITGSYADTSKIYKEPYSSGALTSANPTAQWSATQLQGTSWR